MSPLFPTEIIENSTQKHFDEHHTKSKIIYLIVILVIFISFAILPFISIDITSQNRGIIRSAHENNRLQLVVTGEIETISISENKLVQKGDTLIKIKTDKIDEQILALKQKIDKNNRFINDLIILGSGQFKKLKSAIYITEHNKYLSIIKEKETQVNQLEKEYNTSKLLFEEDIISKMEFLRVKNNYDISLRQLESIKEQYLNNWQTEQARLKFEKIDLEHSIGQLEKEKRHYKLIAPISGTISQFSGYQKGSFITAGQTIAFISPSEELVVECFISPSDIGFIMEGQDVTYQIDAFNYNQWGLAKGKVMDISKDISVINNKAVFRVRCSINKNYLQLKNGLRGYIMKGMTLTGRFYLTERNLWQLLFDKVDNWMNPKILEHEKDGC